MEVTEQTRNLLISLASHMAYMQGQLEARHELDDPEDYYWYRESVALRQKVTDALADGPAVPEGREPASVVSEPSDRELLELMPETMRDEFAYAATACSDATGGQVKPRIFRVCLNTAALEYARAVLARYGHQPAPAVAGEVGELARQLGVIAADAEAADFVSDAAKLTRAAAILSQRHPAPVPVSERLPGPEDCDAEGRCWWGEPQIGDSHDATWNLCTQDEAEEYCTWGTKCGWLPATALPLPAVEVEG